MEVRECLEKIQGAQKLVEELSLDSDVQPVRELLNAAISHMKASQKCIKSLEQLKAFSETNSLP